MLEPGVLRRNNVVKEQPRWPIWGRTTVKLPGSPALRKMQGVRWKALEPRVVSLGEGFTSMEE